MGYILVWQRWQNISQKREKSDVVYILMIDIAFKHLKKNHDATEDVIVVKARIAMKQILIYYT